jgi:hypothetical protein
MVQLTNIIKTAALKKAQANCARAEHFDGLTRSLVRFEQAKRLCACAVDIIATAMVRVRLIICGSLPYCRVASAKIVSCTNITNITFEIFKGGAGLIVESRRDIPYGPINLQKFAHFHWLNPKCFGFNQ